MRDEELELHELFGGRLRLYQYKHGYRFSVDSVLLAAFAAARLGGRVADLGTGSGVLPVLLARAPAIDALTGFEIQPALAALAEKNVALHTLQACVDIRQADIKSVRSLARAESFDAVVANPPFYRIGTGKTNPGTQDAAARHELLATLDDFLDAASYLLKNSGKCCAIYPAGRSADLIAELRRRRLEPKVLRFVHSRAGEAAVLLLVLAAKNAGSETTVLPPLVLFGAGDSYTAEAQGIFDGL